MSTTSAKIFTASDPDPDLGSGSIVAVNYGDYRWQEASAERAAGRRGRRSDLSEGRFRDFVESRDGVILEDAWLGAMYEHSVRCVAGHDCRVIPNAVTAKGRRGFCRICARQDPGTAEAKFRDRVAMLGGEVLEPWHGSGRPHRVRCAGGHESFPTPGNVSRGQGICAKCSGNDPELSSKRFRAAVASLGMSVLGDDWLGVDAPHPVRCANGHEIEMRPSSLAKAKSLCQQCAGHAPDAVAARFWGRVAALGGSVLEDHWLGNNKRHHIRCRAGHVVTTRPDHVADGIGICHLCAGRSWDVFYVVANYDTDSLKFGITSGNPRPRLADHAHDGFRDVLLLLTALGDGAAISIERVVKKQLRSAGYRPVRGYEYFDLDARDAVFFSVAGQLVDCPADPIVSIAADGWKSGRKRLCEQVEDLRDEEDVPPGYGWRRMEET